MRGKMKIAIKSGLKKSDISIFLGFLFIGVWLLFANQVCGLRPTMSTPEILKQVQAGADLHSYLQAGFDLTRSKSLFLQDKWVISLWPPGMVAFHAIFIFTFSSAFSAFAEGIFAVLLISFLAVVAWRSKIKVHPKTRIALLILYAFGIYYGLNFSIYSVCMTDLWFVLLACGCLAALMNARSAWRSVLAGILLASAAYFRQVGENSFYVFFFFSIFLLLRDLFKTRSTRNSLRKATDDFLVVGAYLLVTAPWRILRYSRIHSLSWSGSDRVLWAHVWMNDNYLAKVHGGWVRDQGGNWGCNLNLRVCEKINIFQGSQLYPFNTSNSELINSFRKQAIFQIFENPIGFFIDRIHFFFKALFGNLQLHFEWLLSRNLLSISSLVVLIALTVKLVTGLLHGSTSQLILLSLILGLVISILPAHIETRYVWTILSITAFAPLVTPVGRLKPRPSSQRS